MAVGNWDNASAGITIAAGDVIGSVNGFSPPLQGDMVLELVIRPTIRIEVFFQRPILRSSFCPSRAYGLRALYY